MEDTVTTWAAGDYPSMAERLESAAVLVVETAQIGSGDTVLDVATGTGNAALLAASTAAEVVGIDFEPALLALASERSRSNGLEAQWVKADVDNMPVGDEWASAIVSVFGVMYGPDHDAASAEMARCIAPGGRIVLAAWVPGSFMPAMGPALAQFLPPPPLSSGPPSRWGDVDSLRELASDHDLEIDGHSLEMVTMEFADVDMAAQFFVQTAGHVMTEKGRLVANGQWEELESSMRDLVRSRALPAGGGITIRCDYLLATLRPSDRSRSEASNRGPW
jgi:SAM-dependent methyltransferase